jgi:hypothetical protein
MKTKSHLLVVSLGTVTLLLGICPEQALGSLDPWAERYVGTMVRDVTYGGGLFVAVGDAFYDSTDGVCWTRRPLDIPSINGMWGVAYGNGRFVAVESGAWRRESRVFTSTDGTAWQQSATMPASQLPVIDRVFFGGGTFLAVGQEPNPSTTPGYHWLIMTSSDGISWTRHSGPTNSGESYYLNAAAYGNGVFVAGGWSGLPAQQGLVLTSTDLTTWVAATGFPFTVVQGLAYGKGLFVAAGSAIATSADGVRWTNQTVEVNGRLNGVAFGDDSFVAIGEPQLILSSTDAIHWIQHATPVDSLQGITYGQGSFVAVGGYATDHPRGVAVQSGGGPQICLEALPLIQIIGISPETGADLMIFGQPGRTHVVECSPDTVTWTAISTVVMPPAAAMPIRDANAATVGNRFYRVVEMP